VAAIDSRVCRIGCGKAAAVDAMYLFDTDVISHLFKKKPPPVPANRLAAVPARDQFISTFTVAAIVHGARKSARPDFHLDNLLRIHHGERRGRRDNSLIINNSTF
jgi:predicted nucleic acid-binding protein